MEKLSGGAEVTISHGHERLRPTFEQALADVKDNVLRLGALVERGVERAARQEISVVVLAVEEARHAAPEDVELLAGLGLGGIGEERVLDVRHGLHRSRSSCTADDRAEKERRSTQEREQQVRA